ncbi:CMGC/GSK protein kinase [Fasciola gigantica]|uniref:CMGC/GSK protein kinase n=1 Tax=Fasciola gigantica TaxID=46835 RepID=A0A504YTZ4_FASGI|nr:CMGC/GSK protein kinase [Fasciola gigantica]
MRQLDHPNIVRLKYFFYFVGERKDDVYLNLFLELVRETVHRVAHRYSQQKEIISFIFIKLYTYQLLRSLAYIHHKGICHRDVKPQNLLLNPATGVLKLCDFDSAKVRVSGESNVSYTVSRYYRALELIFVAAECTCEVDIWSSGCMPAEPLLDQPIFPDDSGVDQLVGTIKVLETPIRDQIHEIDPDYRDFRFPQIRPHPWSMLFRPRVSSDAVQLVFQLLNYSPSKQLKPIQAMTHLFFDELRMEETRLPNDRSLPPLLNFSPYEPSMSDYLSKLTRVDQSDLPSGGTTNPTAGAEADSCTTNKADEESMTEPSASLPTVDSKLSQAFDLAGEEACSISEDQKPVGDGAEAAVTGSNHSTSENSSGNNNGSATNKSSTHGTHVGIISVD